MIYVCCTKERGILHDVYFVRDLNKAKKLLVDKVNTDDDDYHTWTLVEVIEGEDLLDCKTLYSIVRPVNDAYPKWDKSVVGINPKHYHSVEVGDLK